jgi:hypothetical protein
MWWDDQLSSAHTPSPLLPALRAEHSQPVQTQAHQLPAVTDPWQWWWRHARASARRFVAGIDPPGIEVYGPVLDDDEEGILEADVVLSRLYGGDGSYRRSDFLVVARPAVMAGALAVNAVVNHRRKAAARRRAAVRWRDDRPVHVWATTHRLICDDGHGTESCWYGSVNEFHPDLSQWSLTLAFDDGSAPVRLVGPPAPALCLWAATAVLGDRWDHDPRLAALLA